MVSCFFETSFNSIIAVLPPDTERLDHGKHTLLINILTAVLGAMFFVAAIIVVMIFKKLKREKIKKQLAIETARAVIVTHWTKKVTVEKPQINGMTTDAAEGLVSSLGYINYKNLFTKNTLIYAFISYFFIISVDASGKDRETKAVTGAKQYQRFHDDVRIRVASGY